VIAKFLNFRSYTKKTQPLLLNLFLNLSLILLPGCATTKITGVDTKDRLKPNTIGQRKLVTIAPYMTIPKHRNPKLDTKYLDQKTGLIYIGRKSDNPPRPNELGHKLTESLSKTLERETENIVVIKETPPRTGLWIKGQMTQEVQGSRALRTLIGLGAGKTKLDTITYVYNLDKSKKAPWLTIWTSGHSGYEPGAVFSAMPSPIPIFNILGATSTIGTIVNHSNKGLTQDAKRTGKVLGNKLAKQIHGQKLKNKGRLPSPLNKSLRISKTYEIK
jgi:hypothetical protein